MDRTTLINSANNITKCSESAATEYIKMQDLMVARMNQIMEERADILELVGENNISMMRDNHSNHSRFIGAVLTNFDAEVLVDTILWVFKAYRSHQFNDNYWAAQLNNWISVIKESLNEKSYNDVYPIYEWMQINIPIFSIVAHSESNNVSKSQH